LLARTQGVFGLFETAEVRPAGVVAGFRARWRDDRLARNALDRYRSFVVSAPGLDGAGRAAAMSAADAIAQLVDVVDNSYAGGG
jgi:hypothetical protein